MKTFESIMLRLWIVFSALVSVVLLALVSESNYKFALEFVAAALVGWPIAAYTIYRTARYITHGV
jgi:hypothetical protein